MGLARERNVTAEDVPVAAELALPNRVAQNEDARRIEAIVLALDWAIAGSVPFGLYVDGVQVGFARAVTDGATFAWIADVFVLSDHRGQGFGRRLLEAVLVHPGVRGARNILLATADAHGLYRSYGFRPLAEPHRYLNLRPQREQAFAPAPSDD